MISFRKKRKGRKQSPNADVIKRQQAMLDEPSIQLEESQQRNSDYWCIHAVPEISENCNSNQTTRERQTGSIPYENESQITATNQKALTDIKSKYTDSEGYEIPQGYGQKLSKFKKGADSIAYENVPKPTEEQVILGDNATDFKQTIVQHGDNGFSSRTNLQMRILPEFPQMSGGQNQHESEVGVYEALTPEAEDDEIKKNVYLALIK